MAGNKKFISIAGGNVGSKAVGITVLDSDGVLTTLDGSGEGAPWRASAPFGNAPALHRISGNAADGVVGLGADSKQLKCLTVVNNALGEWKDLVAPSFAVEGIAGNPAATLVAFGKKKAAMIDLKSDGAAWTDLPDQKDLDIIAAAGDPVKELYVVGNGARGGKVLKYRPAATKPPVAPNPAAGAKPGDGAKGADGAAPAPAPEIIPSGWDEAKAVPFKVELMCGDAGSGYVLYGEGQLISVMDFSKPHTRLPAPPFLVSAISGNPKDGVVAIAGQGDFIVYSLDPSKPAWSIAAGPLMADSTAAAPAAT